MSSSCWYSMIVQGPPKERGSQSCRGCSSHLWSDVAFDHWSTHKCNRVLRRAYQMTGRQECLPVIAQPRRDEDRARILVLPRSSALLHWPIPPSWGSWFFEEFPVHRSLDPCCSARARTLRSRLRILALPALSKRVPALRRLRQESRVYLVPPVWVCGPPLASPIRLCGRVALVLEFRLAFFPRIWEPTEVAPEVHIFAWLPAMDPFLSRIVAWPSWSWRTWLRDLIPIFRPQKRLFWRPPSGHTSQLNILCQWGNFILGCPSASVCLKCPLSTHSHPDSDLKLRHTGGCQKSHDGSVHFPLRKSLQGFFLPILKDLLLLDCHFYKASFRQSGSAFSK